MGTFESTGHTQKEKRNCSSESSRSPETYHPFHNLTQMGPDPGNQTEGQQQGASPAEQSCFDLFKIDFEVVLSEKALVSPASLAPRSPRQTGYYYYLLFVDRYLEPSVRSSSGPGSQGARAWKFRTWFPELLGTKYY